MKKEQINEVLVLAGKVFVVAAVVILAVNYKHLSEPGAVYRCLMGALATALIWGANSALEDILSGRFPWFEAPVKRLMISIAATFAITFVIWWFIAAAWFAPEKGFDLMRPMRGFELTDFLPTLFITLFISIFMHGRAFLLNWRDTAAEAERLKKEQAEARFEALKNQVNPHFLFNSLNVLATLVHKDADQAEQFIRRLSTVYRYVLDSRDKEVVTLDEELKALEAFLFLMKTRFGDAFEARIEVPDRQGRVAPLTLQMLVENALKHNEVSKSMPLSISIVQQNGHLEVRNNLQPRSNPGEGSGVGLENIRGRYRFLTDRPLDVRRDADFFTVIVPIV